MMGIKESRFYDDIHSIAKSLQQLVKLQTQAHCTNEVVYWGEGAKTAFTSEKGDETKEDA